MQTRLEPQVLFFLFSIFSTLGFVSHCIAWRIRVLFYFFTKPYNTLSDF